MIVAHNLQKSFGKHRAVDGVSFSIDRGVVGFLGANGAGKSTTMRVLTGFLDPDSGHVEICGYNIADDKQSAQACIGYLPEAFGGFSHLTVIEVLRFCGEARGFWGGALRTAVHRSLEMLDLGDAADKKIQTLSKGWRQRVWLAQAILHRPPVLILDEPTDGLDPFQRDQVRSLISRLSSEAAILLSTHMLEEAEEVCDRIIVIRQGQIVADDATSNLVDEHGRLATTFRQLAYPNTEVGQVFA